MYKWKGGCSMEKVLKGIKNSFGKIGTAYKKFSEKDARIDTT